MIADRLEHLPKGLVVTFAADCAERALPIFERAYPDDPRPREAIAAVRRWLGGSRKRTLIAFVVRLRRPVVSPSATMPSQAPPGG